MKKTALAMAIFIFSHALHADQIDQFIDMSVEQMKQSGQINDMASCIGTSETKTLSAYTETMKLCLNKHGIFGDDNALLDSCIMTEASNRLNINTAKLKACAGDMEEDEYAEEDFDDTDMSDEEFQAHLEKQQEQALAKIDAMIDMSKKINKGTEGLITLPVYSASEIIAHYTEGFSLTGEQKGIPVATFSSDDSVEKIADFYTKELPHFKRKNFDGDMVIFMEKMPSDFDPLKDLNMLQHTPHVSIYSLPSKSKQQTSIEIAYTKK